MIILRSRPVNESRDEFRKTEKILYVYSVVVYIIFLFISFVAFYISYSLGLGGWKYILLIEVIGSGFALIYFIRTGLKKEELWFEYGGFSTGNKQLELNDISELISINGDIVTIQPLVNKNELLDYSKGKWMDLNKTDIVKFKFVDDEFFEEGYLEYEERKFTLTSKEYIFLKELQKGGLNNEK